jgi:DNA-directed RNA polymerase specialized sigma24 family protein
MTGPLNDAYALLDCVRNENPLVFEKLFNRHRRRLQKAIAMRMDRRLAHRYASDVLQETFIEAC